MDSVLNMETNVHFVGLDELLNSDNIESQANPLYSMWLDEGNEYVPAMNLKTCAKIPSGAYKVAWKRDEWHLSPMNINTDELYEFPGDLTSKILNETQTFWDRVDVYKKYNFAHKRGILLCGAPGCGKTAIISLLIKQLMQKDGLIFVVNNTKDFSFISEVLETVVRKIEPDRPVITIIEDIDQLIADMGGQDSQILDFLDGKGSIDHHLVIMTSNDTTELSDALLRPSRVDMVIEVPTPNSTVRKEFFKRKGIKDEDLDQFTDLTEDMSFAELKEVFVGTQILGKDINKVIEQIKCPLECKDYLNNNTNEMKGIE